MGSPVNPAAILAMLQQKQGQSAPPGGPPQMGGGQPDPAQDYAQQVASLKGADLMGFFGS